MSTSLLSQPGCSLTHGTPTVAPTPFVPPGGTPAAWYAVFVGGWDSLAYVANTHVARIGADGTTVAWSTGTNLPRGLGEFALAAAVPGDALRTFGGRNADGVVSVAYSATVGVGRVGKWSLAGPCPGVAYPAWTHSRRGGAFVAGGDATGNQSPLASSAYASARGHGAVAIGASLPVPLLAGQLAETNGFLFHATGYAASYVTDVYRSDATRSAPGTWTSVAPIPSPAAYGQAFSIPGHVYIAGGQDSWSSYPWMWHSAVDSGGNLSGWTNMWLPRTFDDFGVVCVPESFSGTFVAVGGTTGGGVYVDSVYAAWFSNGSLGPWTSQPRLPEPLSGEALVY